MAKPQRRTSAAASNPARDRRTASRLSAALHVRPIADTPPVPAVKVQPASHLEALAAYEQGIHHLQEHDFAWAADIFGRVLAAFPEEREICERARLYLALCDRHLRPAIDEPQSQAERIYAATLALNAGDVDRAIYYLDSVRRDDPVNDQVLYMLATAHAQRGNVQVAIPYLQQAIESNPDNRVLARFDPDLEDLRAEDTIAALLEPPLLHPNGDRTSVSRSLGNDGPVRRSLGEGGRSARTRSAR
jgi:tetratricopeptide (TPR) repeat protein